MHLNRERLGPSSEDIRHVTVDAPPILTTLLLPVEDACLLRLLEQKVAAVMLIAYNAATAYRCRVRYAEGTDEAVLV